LIICSLTSSRIDGCRRSRREASRRSEHANPAVGHKGRCYYRTMPLHVRAMAAPKCARYVVLVWSVQRSGQIAHRTTTCRYYFEDLSSGKTFTVRFVVKASASIGNRIPPLNAPPPVPSFLASSGTITLRNRATTRPPQPILSISSGYQAGQGRPDSPEPPCLQVPPGSPARSQKS